MSTDEAVVCLFAKLPIKKICFFAENKRISWVGQGSKLRRKHTTSGSLEAMSQYHFSFFSTSPPICVDKSLRDKPKVFERPAYMNLGCSQEGQVAQYFCMRIRNSRVVSNKNIAHKFWSYLNRNPCSSELFQNRISVQDICFQMVKNSFSREFLLQVVPTCLSALARLPYRMFIYSRLKDLLFKFGTEPALSCRILEELSSPECSVNCLYYIKNKHSSFNCLNVWSHFSLTPTTWNCIEKATDY